MRDYELMVVLDPNLDEAALEAATGRVSGLVTQRGGTLRSVEQWGRRQLAYPIGRHRYGAYVLVRFESATDATHEIERGLRLMEPVLRHLLVRQGEQAPPPAPRQPAAAAV